MSAPRIGLAGIDFGSWDGAVAAADHIATVTKTPRGRWPFEAAILILAVVIMAGHLSGQGLSFDPLQRLGYMTEMDIEAFAAVAAQAPPEVGEAMAAIVDAPIEDRAEIYQTARDIAAFFDLRRHIS